MKVTKEQLETRINELVVENLNLRDKISILTTVVETKLDSRTVPFVIACEKSIDSLAHVITALTSKIRVI